MNFEPESGVAMAIELRFAPEVEQDLGEAALWYEEQRPGLGDDFLNCVAFPMRSFTSTTILS